MGDQDPKSSSLEEALSFLPASLRGFFQKVMDGVRGTLQATLIDTLVGEFHEKFGAMWNAPGDRDAARALRQCDRMHRETAVQVVGEGLATQLGLLARAVAGTVGKGDLGIEGVPCDMLSIYESKVTRLENAVTAIEEVLE